MLIFTEISNGIAQPSLYDFYTIEIRMPSCQVERNSTLELARRITAYNYRTGKLPPRMNKMIHIWSTESKKREELLQVRVFLTDRFVKLLLRGWCITAYNNMSYEMSCAIWYHLHNLKTAKNTHGRVLLLVKLQASAPRVFFKLCKWYQIAQTHHINTISKPMTWNHSAWNVTENWKLHLSYFFKICLTLSWRRPLSYRLVSIW